MATTQARSLANRVVAITGGTRGIGRATAEALLAEGAKVAIGGTSAERAAEVAAELRGEAIGLGLEVTDRSSFSAFLDETERRLGPIDVLVNNAGIMPLAPFAEEPDDAASRLVDVNLHGVIVGSKLALERFLPRRRGHLVQMASGAGKVGLPGGATYCATKYAVVGLTESLRHELRGTGVDVSLVVPGMVDTELAAGLKGEAIQPGEVGRAIVEALKTGRYEVYVPKSLAPMVWMASVLPRRITDLLGRLFKSDQLLTHVDAGARGGYDARLQTPAS